jgi:hypothetical protein
MSIVRMIANIIFSLQPENVFGVLGKNLIIYLRTRCIHSNLCTLCDNSPETERHYLFCKKNTHTRDKLNESLRHVFNKHKINPVLRKLIYQGLDISVADELEDNGVECELQGIPYKYKNLVDTINNAGMYQLLYGRFPIEWDCGIKDATYGKYLNTTRSRQESPNGYVRLYSRYGIIVTNDGDHGVTTNMDKTKLQDSNMINFSCK